MEDERCGHHCDDDCPRCGTNKPKRPKRKPGPKGSKKWCACEGSDHNHGYPNGM